MSPEEFKLWRKELGFNQTKAAKKLGVKLRTVQYYEKGERKGKQVEIPKSVSLACFAVSCGIADVDFSTPLGRPVKDRSGKFKIKIKEVKAKN
ncbi:helix-turn-helix domain-containing protein [Curvivirga aplysinae]|uniref:helix-turn-helix domain-containing protein n=1 Tax=Curvivirga aplysinae TaxID=2529852 RepID=UPI0012BC9D25|nr:helix-turn-helix transcriptional regulator [Curvivirga aplysinae]MTI09511.1 XRE family transcriptional regulator [Curvivirga aplysinae]